MNKSILWIAAGAAALFLVSRLSFSKKINFLFAGIKPGGTLLQPVIEVSLLVQNPTNQTVTIRSLSGQVLLNNRLISNVSSFNEQTIQPNSETVIKINARPLITNFFSSINFILTSKTGNNRITITGSANIDNVSLPFTITESI